MIGKKWGIETVSDFESLASDMWEEFLSDFTKESGLLRDVEEDDGFDPDDGIVFAYTDRGQTLAERYRDRIVRVGAKHFPNEDIEIYTSLFRTP